MPSKFKVGDNVKIVRTTTQAGQPFVGQTRVVTSIHENMSYPYVLNGTGDRVWQDIELELIKVNEGGSMDSVINKLKELNLSPDEKLLQKYNIVDKQGRLTLEGMDLVANNSFNDQKTAIVAQLKALAKAEKDDAK